jgi:hypothetical protein
MAVARLAMAHSGRLFAATGDVEYPPTSLDLNQPKGYAFGLFFSDDGGATWAAPQCNSATADPGTFLTQVLANPQNGNLYLSSSSGLFRSTDGGNCWTNITPPGAGQVDDIAIQQFSGKTRLIASIQQGQKSTATIGQAVVATLNADAATPVWNQTFQGANAIGQLDPKQLGIGRIRLAARDDVAYAAVPVNDVVTVFQELPVFGDFFWVKKGDASHGCYGGQCNFYDLVVTINPANSLDLVVGGISVNRSTDGGKSFTDLFPSHADTHALAFDPWTPNLLWVGNDGGVEQIQLTSTGVAGTWVERNNSMSTALFLGFSMSSSDPTGQQVAGGLQDNGTMSRRVGRLWNFVSGGDGNATGEDGADASLVYYQITANSGTKVFRNTDKASIGQAAALVNDPRHPGNILGTSVDVDSSTFQLYQGSSASTGKHIQWTCSDPTPQNATDAIMAVLVLPDSTYLIGTQEGLIWKVNPANLQPNVVTCLQKDVDLGLLVWFGAPKFAPGASPVAQGQITGLALDPRDPSGQSFYATLGRYDQWRIVHFAYQAPTKPWWVATPIAANFPHAKTPSCLDCFSPGGTIFGPIVVDPVATGRVYVGTDDGLFVGTQDNVGNWNWTADQSFPEVWVEGLGVTQKLPVASNVAVRASTFGRSMLERVFPMAISTQRNSSSAAVYAIDHKYEWQRSPTATLAIHYELAQPVSAVLIDVQVLQHGDLSPMFRRLTVTAEGREATLPVTIIYGGKATPLTADSDGILVVLRDAKGRVITEERKPIKLRWRRADAQTVYVEAVAHLMSGAPEPVTAELDISGLGRIKTPDSLAFRKAEKVIFEAPSQVETSLGTADFVSWTAFRGDGSTIQNDVRATAEGRRLEVEADSDSVVRANYRIPPPRVRPGVASKPH